MKHSTLIITIFILTLSLVMADTPKEHHECPAPIGVMGEHQHKAGEMMLGYRFMTMDMQGLQSGMESKPPSRFSRFRVCKIFVTGFPWHVKFL